MPSNQNLVLGAGLILLSEMFLVLSGMTVKYVADQLPLAMMVFCRNLFGLLLLLPWMLRQGVTSISTSQLGLHLLRAGVGVTAMGCLFYSWSVLPLAQAALLKQTAPLFIPLLAFLWLGERLPVVAKLALVLGFIGTAAILNPQQGVLNIGVLIAVMGALLGAFAKVVVRKLRHTEPASRIVFYFALFAALISALPAYWQWQALSWQQWGWLLLMAGSSTLAQLLLSRAYGLAPAGRLAPFTYGSVLFASLMGWLLWQESLTLNTLLGMALIVGAGLLALSAREKAPAN